MSYTQITQIKNNLDM